MENILYLLRKVKEIFKELFYMIKKHKLYFLAPIFMILALLAFFIYTIGPAIIISFIYAGI